MAKLLGNTSRLFVLIATRAAFGIVAGSAMFFVTLSVLVAFGVVLSALVYSLSA